MDNPTNNHTAMNTTKNNETPAASDLSSAAGSKLYVYRASQCEVFREVDTTRKAWLAIGEIPWGEPYEVRNENGDILEEFIPF